MREIEIGITAIIEPQEQVVSSELLAGVEQSKWVEVLSEGSSPPVKRNWREGNTIGRS